MTTNATNSVTSEESTETSDDETKYVLERSLQIMKRPTCKLDKKGQISLQDILSCFNEPIGEERAWALCFQAAKTLSHVSHNRYFKISELSEVYLHKNGDVIIDSKCPTASEREAIFSLGVIVFRALDFGSKEEEERTLSPLLEELISSMTNLNQDSQAVMDEERLQETDDEGIERDSGETDTDEFMIQRTGVSYVENSTMCSLKHVLNICSKHVQSSSEIADTHYHTVIRAFVSEALELSQFLEKVEIEKLRAIEGISSPRDNTQHGSTSLQHLDTLGFNDWARFWVQVISELRKGVKLKRVEANLNSRERGRGRGAEFELTPYEILMDDIRERRYHLRKTPSPNPHLKKDVHAIILEFIRSRPPLKKASERQLPPLRKECTLRELLMESIKKPPKPLRPSRDRHHVATLEENSALNDQTTSNDVDVKGNGLMDVPKPARRDSTSSNSSIRRTRKVIPVDFDLKLDAEDDDDDDEDYNEELTVTRFDEEDEAYDYTFENRDDAPNQRKDRERDDDETDSANPWRKTGGLRLTRNEYHRFCDAQLESYDLATQCPSRRASARKHAVRHSFAVTSFTGTTSLPHSRPQSRQHTLITGAALSQGPSPNISLNPSPSLSPQPRARQPRRANTVVEGKDNEERIADWQEDSGQKATLGDIFLDERLSLTLEEIVHIRSVLTKAELESLPVEGRVKEDVEKRRVCFLCLKTRFGLLGPWGQRCRLCKRTVCVKCYSKMRIPTEHFAHVPVVLLSPGLLLSPSSSEPDTTGKNSWARGTGAVGSAPVSPASRRKDSTLRSGTPASTPAATPVCTLTPTSASPSPSYARREGDVSVDKKCGKSNDSPSTSANSLPSAKHFATFNSPNTEQRLAADRLRGVAVVVCHDCRIMVIQIIKSSRMTRATIRNNVISRLTLSLSPAYV